MNSVPTASRGSRTNNAIKMVVSEKPTMATDFLPNRMERNVEHSTPITVTNWLDMLKRLKPTEETLALLESITRPKVFNKYDQTPCAAGLTRPTPWSSAK